MKHILISTALFSKFIDLLKEKVKMDILESSIALYSNQWFIVSKKFENLRFIQDMKPANKMTIKNMESRLVIDEAFVGHVFYSSGDLY